MKKLTLSLVAMLALAALAGVVGNSIPTLKVEILEVDGVKYRATYRLEKLEIEKAENAPVKIPDYPGIKYYFWTNQPSPWLLPGPGITITNGTIINKQVKNAGHL